MKWATHIASAAEQVTRPCMDPTVADDDMRFPRLQAGEVLNVARLACQVSRELNQNSTHGGGGPSGSKKVLSGSGPKKGPLRIRGGGKVLSASVLKTRCSQHPPQNMGWQQIPMEHGPARDPNPLFERSCRDPS